MRERGNVEIEALIVCTTEKAVCVRRIGDNNDEWLPKSQINSPSGMELDGLVGEEMSIRITEWIAGEKGFLG